MEYAIQLILPIIGGLILGDWLSKTYGISPLWTVLLSILGMVMGIYAFYKRGMAAQTLHKKQHSSLKKGPKDKSLQKDAKTKPPTNHPDTPNPPSSEPPKESTTLDALHDLYQQIEQHPPKEANDFPPNLDKELNHDNTRTEPPKAGD